MGYIAKVFDYVLGLTSSLTEVPRQPGRMDRIALS